MAFFSSKIPMLSMSNWNGLHYNCCVVIQVNKYGANIMSFLEWPKVRIPLVELRSPNMPQNNEDTRFKSAPVFRQRVGRNATAAACQQEVVYASSGRASGRPHDQITKGSRNLLASQATDREGHILALDTQGYQDPRGLETKVCQEK